MFENVLEGSRKFYEKEKNASMWRHPKFIRDESIFTLDIEYQLSLINPTNLESSKAQKLKN
jgi:hypothetical protein